MVLSGKFVIKGQRLSRRMDEGSSASEQDLSIMGKLIERGEVLTHFRKKSMKR